MSYADLDNLIEAIHAAPSMVVIEFAGAGAQALSWLHGVGGSSRTILEATDRYAASSVVEAAGFEPEQFTSPKVVRALATKAYIRACQLAEPGTPVAGIGCTAAIATDRPKRGEHRCCVAVCDVQGVTIYELILTKGARTRQQEEELVSLMILKAVANICRIERLHSLPLEEGEEVVETIQVADLLERLVAEDFKLVTVWPDGRMIPGNRLPHSAVLSGSFNPLHQGHREMAQVAEEMLNQEVYFELPLVNADKETIAPQEARRRVDQFAGFAPVVLTTAPLFSEKTQLFPHTVFVVGADTASRLIQPRFYNDNPDQMLTSLEQIRVAGCQFLVAGRLQNGCFVALKDLSLPAGYKELFQEIPEAAFRKDISSTTLRKQGVPP